MGSAEETPVTRHLHHVVELLNDYLHNRTRSLVQEPLPEDESAFEAVFELVDLPWDDHTEEDGLFREGYETALQDITNAIGEAWGFTIPEVPK